MASKKHLRRKAREAALALLYSADITEQPAPSIVDEGLYPDEEILVSDYAEKLVSGTVEHLEDIDARLAATSENWSVDRMPVVDRIILRLAVYEMLYVSGVPISVAINEAVELAKAYGGEDESARFVNGVLGRIARSDEGRAVDEAERAAKRGKAKAQGEEAAEGSGEPALSLANDLEAMLDMAFGDDFDPEASRGPMASDGLGAGGSGEEA